MPWIALGVILVPSVALLVSLMGMSGRCSDAEDQALDAWRAMRDDPQRRHA